MTALERALVVYAEAKGYEIEVHIEDTLWNVKGTPGFFNFATCDYRIKNREDYRETYDELSDFFKPLYTPEKKRTWNIEDLKKAPRQGFFCKTVTLTREEIEEMNKPKEEEFDVKAYVKSLVEIPETHKFALDMKFKVGDKVKIKPSFKDNNIYEVCGFEYYQHAYNQCSGTRYQLIEDSKGEDAHWAREDALELYVDKQPEAIPATEEELEIIGKGVRWCRSKKDPNRMGWIRHNDKLNKSEWLLFDAETKTWQDWGSK